MDGRKAMKRYSTSFSQFSSVAQSCPTLCDPMDYTVHGILQARILEWGAFPFSRGSSQPRDRSQVSCITESCNADSLPAEPQGKPKNTGAGSLSLLQQIFPTQELNQDLLYQLSYQGSPDFTFSSVQFSRSVSNSLLPYELQHARPLCPSPTPGVHSDSRPSSR